MVRWDFEEMVKLFNDKNYYKLLIEGIWGLEKESLRAGPDGNLVLTPHPEIFGDKIKNPYYTTDFSESQLEIITPPLDSIEKAVSFLEKLNRLAMNNIGDELLWPYSMPSILPDENNIPIAKFNDSESGRQNEIYRNGLAVRYGKKMQMISGIHYNFSFKKSFWDILYHNFSGSINEKDFIHNSYFSIARNYLRFRWLLIYLFGASPAVDESFADDRDKFNELNKYREYAVSLRMSPLGYSSRNKKLDISYDNLPAYIEGLEKMLKTEDRELKELGIFQNGKQVQLNAHILQKESEFYSPIRFKSDAGKEKSQLETLKSDGISYIEIRSIDLNPYERSGVNREQLYFLHAFLLYCLFEKSDLIADPEAEEIDENDRLVSLSGRKKDLKLIRPDHQKIQLAEWAEDILKKMKVIAGVLDRNFYDRRYQKSVSAQEMKLRDRNLLPSAKIMNELNNNPESIIDFGLRKAGEYKGENNGIFNGKKWGPGIVNPDPYQGSCQKRCCC